MIKAFGDKSYESVHIPGKIKKNCSFIDIFFNYCGEDIYIAVLAEDLLNFGKDELETIISYDWPLDMKTLLNKIRKMKSFEEFQNENAVGKI